MTFANRPGLAALLGGLVALTAQKAFDSTFTDMKAVVVERITFPMIQAEIDSYRVLPESIKCSPQISNTISNLNARIEHEHSTNQQWFLVDWGSTDRWNAVEPIHLSCDNVSIAKQ